MNNKVTALTNFAYEDVGVRVLGTKYEPWFVAVDVLRALDIHTKNISRILERLDDDEKLVVNLTTESDTNYRGNPDVWLVSEPGLYKIMFRSRTPKAEAFTRFVTHEVLPSIRRYGYYKVPKKRGRPALPKENKDRLPVVKTYTLSSGEALTKEDLRRVALSMGALQIERYSAAQLVQYIEDRRKYLTIVSQYPYTEQDIDAFTGENDIEYYRSFIRGNENKSDYSCSSCLGEHFSQKFVDLIVEADEKTRYCCRA